MIACHVCGSEPETIDDGREVATHYLGCERSAHRRPAPAVEVMQTVEQCEVEDCDNPRYSGHPRVKYCEGHKDPKSRKG